MNVPDGRASRRRALGHLLARLYPHAWRARYGEELAALIDDDPPGVRGAATLLAGACGAHLRPPPQLAASTPASVRMRTSIAAVFICWVGISLAGGGFQKETEGAPFASAALQHPLLGYAHDVVLAGALVGAAVIAIGGLPLLFQALAEARARRARRLALLLALPAAAVACFAGVTLVLIAAMPSSQPRASAATTLLALVWLAAAIACAGACALAPRLVLTRVTPSQRALRVASVAALPLAGAMAAITLGLVVYDLALCLQAPQLAAESGGGPWPVTGVALAAAALVAAACTVLALVGARRAYRAAAVG